MSGYSPKHTGPYTMIATAAVTGGRIVTSAGAQAAADSTTFIGVASKDAAIGEEFTVFSGFVQRLSAAGAIAKNALVKCAASGQITTFTDGTDAVTRRVGIALQAATNPGDVIAVHWTH